VAPEPLARRVRERGICEGRVCERFATEALVSRLAITLGCALAAMLALWALSLRRRDASIVDVWWGPGLALQAGIAAALAPAPGPRSWLLLGMVTVFGLRLGLYLGWRNGGRGEDPRYQAMRRRWGTRFPWWSLAAVFGLQGVLQWFVSLPAQVALLAPGTAGLGALDALGLVLFGVGLGFEAVGDLQLARFRADPANAGRVLEHGLWRYTRHPNYFGDSLAHWGLFTVALATPWGWLTAPCPALMTFLLLRVSGVPLLERSMARRRPDYAAYQRRTSAFVPRPPRRGGSL
jgi:steroid 5-alpha reductase family enzyme